MGIFPLVFIPSLFPDFCKVVLKNLGGLDGRLFIAMYARLYFDIIISTL